MKKKNAVIDDCHKSGECDPVADIYTMLLDLGLMVAADIFVGGFSTNVARVAYELMVSRKGCYPPFISLDVPWCHNNGRAMGDKYLPAKFKNLFAGQSC